jgi:hypothetical protein
MSTLNGLSGVTAQGELFLPRERVKETRWDSDFARPRFIETKPEGLAFRPFSAFSYLNALYNMPGAVGFKLMYAQLRMYPEILVYFVRHRVRVIHLVRRNHLDVLISYAVKAKLGRAHLLTGQSRPDEIRVELEAEDLIRRLDWLQKQQTIARRLLILSRLPHLEIGYEDLLRDQANFFPILDFLSIDGQDQPPQSALVKIRQQGQRDVISNYDQVRATLAGSQFASLLE